MGLWICLDEGYECAKYSRGSSYFRIKPTIVDFDVALSAEDSSTSFDEREDQIRRFWFYVLNFLDRGMVANQGFEPRTCGL